MGTWLICSGPWGQEADARAAVVAAPALRAAVEHVGVGAVDREAHVVGAVKGARHRHDAVDGQHLRLAIDGAGRLRAVGVELDHAIERVAVAHHGERYRIALVDGYLINVRQVERVGAAGAVIEHDELAGLLGGAEDAAEVGGERNGVFKTGEGARGSRRGLRAVVDGGEGERCDGRVNVAAQLLRKGVDVRGIVAAEACDGEAGYGVLQVVCGYRAGRPE